MNMSIVFKSIGVVIILLFIVACGKNRKYQDNSSLEKPPTLAITKIINAPAVNETNPDTGLNDAVILIDATHLNLKQPFDQAWTTLETALEFNRIEISDRNRETGDYFINYDPDNTQNKESEFLDNLTFFLFKDDYEEAPYKITLTKNKQGVNISAEKLEQFQIDLLDDGDEISFDDKTNDGVNKLIRYLYRTLKSDLPLD